MTFNAIERICAVIFDLDGTLVDSGLDFQAMRRELDAPADVGLLEHVERLPSPVEQDRAMAVVHRHERDGAERATWMPGAEAAVHALHRRGIPTAIVTRNSRNAALMTMSRLGMPDMPLMAREDAPPKPDPGALLAVARHWRLPPGQCAYVGDFKYDVEAAQRAGMLPVLYLTDDKTPPAYAAKVAILRDFSLLASQLRI